MNGLIRFVVGAVLPVLLIAALSLLSGLVRTAAVGAFAGIVVIKGLMVALDTLGEAVPTPRVRRVEVAR